MKRFFVTLILTVAIIGSLYAANEVTVSTFLKVSKDNFELTRSVSNLRRDKFGDSSDSAIQNIGTNAHEQLVISADVATNGWAYFRNVNTNVDYNVDVGVQDSNSAFIAFMRLEPGDTAVMRLTPVQDFYAKGVTSVTNTGINVSVNLDYWVNED